MEFHPRPASPGGSHRLLAAELSTGRHIWEQEISGDVITAPVVSDGTAVLGLGDIGPEAAMPVMEGKAMLFKEFANVDAYPICLSCREDDVRHLRQEGFKLLKIYNLKGLVTSVNASPSAFIRPVRPIR